jgi:hypothetical protein
MLTNGTRLGHYQVLGPLGSGGMDGPGQAGVMKKAAVTADLVGLSRTTRLAAIESIACPSRMNRPSTSYSQ